LPFHDETNFLIEPTDVAKVYATTPGRVNEVFVEPGSRVKKGDLLIRLTNDEKEQKRRSLELERDLQQKDVELDRALDDQAQEQVAREILAGIKKQLADRERELSQLEIRSPCDGVVVAPPRIPEPARDDSRRQLSKWYGTPLDPQNFGCYLTDRTPILSIAPSATCDAVLYIDQGDRDDVSVGQEVQIKLEHLADVTYDGKIEKISARESEVAPETLSNKAGGELATVTDKQGREHLTSSAYQATVRLEGDTDLLRPGMRGRSRVTVAHRSAVDWLWRYFRRTFHFRL
jgi:putative peptide zinc metalloprotease protein